MNTNDIETGTKLVPAFVVANFPDWFSSDSFFGRGTDGPAFLGIYLAVGGMLFLARVLVGKLTGSDTFAGSVAAVFFLAMGLLRLYFGYQAGMRRFGFLIILMLIGTFFLAAAGSSAEENASRD